MKLVFTFCGLLLLRVCFGQGVGIGTAGPDPSAQLDISSGARGILIPRMTTAAVSGILNPAKGLMIYDSTRNQLLVNMGSPAAPDWENIVANSGWGVMGNRGTDPATQFIGTADAASLRFGVGGAFAGYIDNVNQNTSFGLGTQSDVTNGVYNTSIGFNALLANAGGSQNTAVGHQVLVSNTTGNSNCAFGAIALAGNTSGNLNIALGIKSLNFNTTGSDNIAVGYGAQLQNVGGTQNTAVGEIALGQTTNSDYNTAVGSAAGSTFDNGYNNVFVGANTDVNGAGYYNVIAMGQGTICTASSQARFGNSATNSIGGYANWTNFSDGRYKKNMKEDVVGLDFIMRLRPLTYNLDVAAIQAHLHATTQQPPKPVVGARGFKTQGAATAAPRTADQHIQQAMAEREREVLSGFSAQEVENAAQAAGYTFSGVDKPKNANDFYGLRYADFVVPLVKAVQEQQQMIKALQKEIEALKEQR